ncbi:hypothetical protein DFQ28_004622 [Apophysomyces sp. BC1034]|nr:hypothetical protein DFQ28_004622 [Apophysomyces sp. BC1034]
MAGMDANEIQRQARNAVRKGSILDVDHGAALCRVSVGDPDDDSGYLQTNWIPWFALAAGDTRDWRPPTKGEQVMLLCPMGDPAQGVALCGFYSDAYSAPAHNPDTHVRAYRDGAVVTYDAAAHVLTVDLLAGATINVTAPGAVNVNTETATVKAATVTLDADVTVTRSMTVKGPLTFESGMTGKGGADGGSTMRIDGAADFTGEVKSQGKSLPHHRHVDDGRGEPSIGKIISTPLASCVKRRPFGSDAFAQVDAPSNGAERTRLYAAIATALMRWEPRLVLTRVQLTIDDGAVDEAYAGKQRVNDAVRAVMLAFAMGNDLEQRAALFGLVRLIVTPADPANNVEAIAESDDSLRERIQLAPQGFSVAGPSAAYVTKARAVDGRIIDAQTSRPRPGDVLVSLLSIEGDGTASDELCSAVGIALSAEDQRPLNDTVLVKSAEIIRYRIRAKGYTRTAVGADVLIAQAKKNAQAYADKVHRIGIGVAESGIKGVCQAAGLSKTELIEPIGDIAIGRTQASYCVEVLLPPNATTLEVRTATAAAAVDTLPIPIRDYWNPDKCPAALLPYLAAEVSVDGWELAESDDARRALIKSAIPLHQKRGTPWAIREVIRRLGFGEVTLVEGRGIRRRDGSTTRNGDYLHGDPAAWAQYIVKLARPITRDQAENLKAVLERYAPQRSMLAALDYRAAPIRHNGIAKRNGQNLDMGRWRLPARNVRSGGGRPREGIDNVQPRQLANRTRYLKDQQKAHAAARNQHPQYAKCDSPAFTGSPQAPRAPQFDNTTLLATTSFVQRALGSFAGFLGIDKSTTLSPAQCGFAIQSFAPAAITATLPSGGDMALGACITFFNGSGSLFTVAAKTNDFIVFNGGQVKNVVLQKNDSLIIMARGSNEWDVVGGSAALQFTPTLGLTAPQFDSGAKLATTAFVQRAVGNYSGFLSYTASATLTASNAGSIVNFYGGAPSQVITLPAASSVAAGAGRSGADLFVVSGQANPNSVTLQPGDDLLVYAANSGTQWVIGGSAARQYNATLGVTAPQFDNTTKFATTAFVHRALGGMAGFDGAFQNITATANIPLSDIGKLIVLGGPSSQVVNLPSTDALPDGATITLCNQTPSGGSVTYTLTAAANQKIVVSSALANTMPLGPGDFVALTVGGGNWIMSGGMTSLALSRLATSQGLLSPTGYQRLAGGLIMQWVQTIVGPTDSNGNYNVTLPIAYPNAQLMANSVDIAQQGVDNHYRDRERRDEKARRIRRTTDFDWVVSMGQKFAEFNEQGVITAFYDDVDSPAPIEAAVVAITDAEWVKAVQAQNDWRVSGGRLTPAPAPTDAELLAAAKAAAIAALNTACRDEIAAGFSSSVVGREVFYPTTETDQRNLLSSALAAAWNAGEKGRNVPLWCRQGDTWAYVTHTAEQVQRVNAAWVEFRTSAQQKYADATDRVSAATSVDAVREIVTSPSVEQAASRNTLDS